MEKKEVVTSGDGSPEVDSELFAKSTKGASFLILSLIFTKVITFVMNQMLVRYVSPLLMGVSAYYEFILNTILFLSRECGRVAVQRASNNGKVGSKNRADVKTRTLQSVMNFGFIALMLGGCFSAIALCLIYRSSVYRETIAVLPLGRLSLLLTGMLVLCELAFEPLYAVNQFELDLQERSLYEGLATLLKCLFTFTGTVGSKMIGRLGKDLDGDIILAFSSGRLAYSLCLLFLYRHYYARKRLSNPEISRTELRPVKLVGKNGVLYYFDRDILSLWKGLFLLMIFKQLLTEGDKLVISYYFTVEEQGMYSVVSNYGSLLARLIFQPIEEALRLYLARILHSEPSLDLIVRSYETISVLSTAYLCLSVLILVGGYSNASFVLKMLIATKGSSWSSTPIFSIFAKFVGYIPLLAFNGIFEAFFNSAATADEIVKFSKYLVLLSMVIFSSLITFIKVFDMRLDALILCNAFNMALRITYCSRFINMFYVSHKVALDYFKVAKKIVIHLSLGLIIEVFQYNLFGNAFESSSVRDLIFSAGLCVIYLLVALLIERHWITRYINISPVMKRKLKIL